MFVFICLYFSCFFLYFSVFFSYFSLFFFIFLYFSLFFLIFLWFFFTFLYFSRSAGQQTPSNYLGFFLRSADFLLLQKTCEFIIKVFLKKLSFSSLRDICYWSIPRLLEIIFIDVRASRPNGRQKLISQAVRGSSRLSRQK